MIDANVAVPYHPERKINRASRPSTKDSDFLGTYPIEKVRLMLRQMPETAGEFHGRGTKSPSTGEKISLKAMAVGPDLK